MGRHLVHIILACVIGASSPSASLVRLSCDYSGATTLTMCTIEDNCASDPCCPGSAGAKSIRADCCRADVFSITSTSPVPAAPGAHAIPVFICNLAPEKAAPVSHVEANVPAILIARNLPLLV
jgi:hypothetical protein